MAKIEYTEQGLFVDGDLLSWGELEFRKNSILYKDYILVKTSTRYSRDTLETEFVIHKNEWEEIKKDLAKYEIEQICLGEVCGKHSNVTFYVNDDIKEEITDMKQVSDFINNNGLSYSNFEGGVYWPIVETINEHRLENTNEDEE